MTLKPHKPNPKWQLYVGALMICTPVAIIGHLVIGDITDLLHDRKLEAEYLPQVGNKFKIEFEEARATLSNDPVESLLRDFEGFRPCPYKCKGGKWTIGYGSTLTPLGPVTSSTACINQAQAIELKRWHIDTYTMPKVIRWCNFNVFSYNEKAAALSFVYNTGKSPCVNGKISAAKIGRYTYAGGKYNPGLERRRMSEITLALSKE